MKKVFVTLVFITGSLLLIGVGAVISYGYWEKSLMMKDIKVYSAILGYHSEKLEPQLKEFLKARYYHVIRCAPRKALHTAVLKDFGSVNSDLLRGLPIDKGPVDVEEDYLYAKQRILEAGRASPSQYTLQATGGDPVGSEKSSGVEERR